ncbi:MAG TPA: transcription antitermination factor NusB [Anaerovoracaceae bacterium]|nr:transcription antitermination factor NusB [Anaerovoracaceae bacterium]
MRRDDVRDARELAMKIVFQMDVNNDFDYSNVTFNEITERYKKNHRAIDILDNIKTNIDAIDELIASNSNTRKVGRIPKTDLAILRVAICEIMYIEDVPDAVAINEAVDMVKKYGSDNAKSYVNALLGNIVKNKKDYE